MSALLLPGYGRDVDAWLFLKQLHWGWGEGAGGMVPWSAMGSMVHLESTYRRKTKKC